MTFFTGEYDCKLDAKGRLALPAKVKSALPDVATQELVLRLGFESCLVLYPMLEYKKIINRVRSLSEFNEEYRKFQRSFFRGNLEIEMDGSGRINIPARMMSYASLEKDVVLVGLGNRVEIWNPDLYEENLINDTSEYSKLAEKYLAED